MAKFNPETGVDPGREYDFKGAAPNQAGEILLKGTANAADDFTRSMYTVVTDDIQERARRGEEGIQDNLFNTADLSAAQSSTTNAGVAQPEDLVRGFGKMERLKNAYSKGAITESDYLSSVDVLTKNLRNRYGDKWANEIDSAVAGAVSNSANAYRRQLFQEWDAGRSASDKAAEKEREEKERFVTQNSEFFYRHPEMVENPWNFSMGQLRKAYNEVKVPKMLLDEAKTRYDVAKEQGQATKEDTKNIAMRRAAAFLGTIEDRSGAQAQTVINKMIQDSQADGKVDPEEKNQIVSFLAQVEPEIQKGLNDMLLADYPEMDESDKQEVLAMGAREVKMYRDMIFQEHTGLFAMAANKFKWAGEEAMFRGMKANPNLANFTVVREGLRQYGMEDWGNQLALKFMEENPDGDKIPEFKAIAGLLIGESNINEFVVDAYNARGDGNKVLEVFRHLRDAVTSEQTATKAKAQAASVLFAPENSEFMSSQMMEPKMATRVYDEMITGDMIQTMSAMKGTDMVTWDNYYNWVFDPGFKAVFQWEMNSVLPDAEKVKLKFDATTMSFSSVGRTADQKARGSLALDAKHIEYTDNFVKRINIWIKKVTPILESNGDDPVFELNRIFEANGITEPKEDNGKLSFMQKAFSAMRKEKEKLEAVEASGKDQTRIEQ